MKIRFLERNEVPLVWQIDRRAVIENIYTLDHGKLIRRPDYFNMQGWPPKRRKHLQPKNYTSQQHHQRTRSIITRGSDAFRQQKWTRTCLRWSLKTSTSNF